VPGRRLRNVGRAGLLARLQSESTDAMIGAGVVQDGSVMARSFPSRHPLAAERGRVQPRGSTESGETRLAGMRRVGDRAWLLDAVDAAGLARGIRLALQPDDVEDVVPAASTVLLIGTRVADPTAIERQLGPLLAETAVRPSDEQMPGRVEIGVRYDGPDLAELADLLGHRASDIADLHSASIGRVAFFGFAPGFAYIEGNPAALHVARRNVPRPLVGPGQVAIAGSQTVIYPGGTPGGWRIIGSTDVTLWDIASTPPNLLDVGDEIVFRRLS
jgi:5-oxoprolinase (ATP-hydrolysing) subunit B